jgi:GH24 family phage-related lysozyme (muramidase)
MTTGTAGCNLIKNFERLKLNAYLCAADKWTIGYINTGLEETCPVRGSRPEMCESAADRINLTPW